jgi:hypothetical protein
MNNYLGLLRHLLRLSWGNYSGLFKANLSCIVKEITLARRKQLRSNAKAIP